MDSPHALEQAIREKVEEGYTGRVMAGFCWPWTKEADADGELHKDVVVGDYIRPWNANETTKGMVCRKRRRRYVHDVSLFRYRG